MARDHAEHVDRDERDEGPDRVRRHRGHDHIAAVFADRPSAEAAVDSLRSLGFGSERLGVAVHEKEPVDFEHDADAELERDVELGMLAGAPLGALGGITIAALAATGVGVLGVGGVLAVGAASAFWGVMLGGYLGAARGTRSWDEHQDFTYTALKPGEVLVVVCSHGRPDEVRAAMTDAGGRLVSAELPLS